MLYLHGSPIRKISGPVSMTYLRASIEGLPLVMLFGDTHFSMENMCENCDPSDDCYVIYGKPFLEKLDAIGERFAVDFFTETYKGKDTSHGSSGPLHELYNVSKLCYNVPLRSQIDYEFKCPTRNIRWHYADARFFDSSPEGSIFSRHSFIIKKMLEGSRGPFPAIPAEIRSICNRALSEIALMMRKGWGYQAVMDRVSDRIVDGLAAIGGSSIVKQRAGIDPKGLWKMPTFVKRVNTIAKKLDLNVVQWLFDLFDLTDEYTINSVDKSDSIFWNNLRQVYKLIVVLQSPILDAYHISRMFKPTLQSKLIVSYIGSAHCVNIAEFLQYELGYEVVSAVERSESRCLEFEEEVDIETDLQQFRPIPDPDIESKEEDPYFLQLQRERRARVQSYPAPTLDYKTRVAFRLDPTDSLDILSDPLETTSHLRLSRRVKERLNRVLTKVFSWTLGIYNKLVLDEIVMTCLSITLSSLGISNVGISPVSPTLAAFIQDRFRKEGWHPAQEDAGDSAESEEDGGMETEDESEEDSDTDNN